MAQGQQAGGSVTSTTAGQAVGYGFVAYDLIFNLTSSGGSTLLDITTSSGSTSGYTMAPSEKLTFHSRGGWVGFSSIASSAGATNTLKFLATR
jgi:hypothetical protein